MQCTHVDRVSVHPSIKIGGASLGQCKNEALPEFTVCHEHACREALVYQVRHQHGTIKNLRAEMETMRETVKKLREKINFQESFPIKL
uniref:Uncharacterized protein n=2 Tax=viral metagenome TaxID=1070528 RepID=A0A6M3XS26_9ZZZZ